VFVGRLEKQKNLTVLLHALVGLDDVHLTVIGDGSLRSQLEDEVRRLNLNVDFLGAVAHERLPEAIIQNEALVMPSLYEGTPKALLEAMACGVPVIATKSPGITEILTHDQNGYLCGLSVEEIRAAIQAVLKDPNLRERLGQEGVRYVSKHHSLSVAVEQELRIIEKLCRAESVIR
jgi:glycosyltransferase involved in cell wall biosynthesis